MVLNKNNFDNSLFNINNNKIFKDKKFYCFTVVKDPKDKSIKEDIVKLIEIHGGTVQYCVQKYSTDYIILCNSSLIYDRNETYYSNQPNLFSNYEKYKSYKLNILSYTFLFDSIRKNGILDNYDGYLLTDMKEENNGLRLFISQDQDIDQMDFGLFDDDYFGSYYSMGDSSNINGNSNNNINNSHNSNKQTKSIVQEEEEMFDLFGSIGIGSGSDSDSGYNNFNQTLEKEQKQQVVEEEEEEEFNIFNSYDYNSNNETKNNNNNSNCNIIYKERINNLYNSNSSGYLFQFADLNIKILEQIPKDFENQEISGFEQNSKGFIYITTKSSNIYNKSQILNIYDKSKNLKVSSSHFKQVSTGQDHTLVLGTGYNELFSFGTNNVSQQLGIQDDSYYDNNGQNLLNLNIHKIINNNIRIQFISCGKNFSILLDNQYNLYSFGQNDFGQLGIGNNDKVNGICKINKPKDLKEISYISSGNSHTVLISQNDNKDYYYGWGSNLQGQIESRFSNEPNKFQYYNDESFTSKLLCYQDSTIIINKNNEIKIFGVQNDTLVTNLQSNFKSNQQYQLIRLRDKIGVLVYDVYCQTKFYLHSLNYKETSHFKLVSSIVKKLTPEDAIKLVKECFKTSNIKVYQLLEAKFPNKLIDPSNNYTPFHIAAKYCLSKESLEILEILIKLKRYSIDSQDNQLNTPLHLSVLNLNFNVVEYLLLKGCNRNLKNKNGETPLHISVKSSKNIAMSSLLCKHGAQSIPDKVMKTPLQYCISNDEKQNLQNIIFTNQVFISYAHKDSVFVNNLRNLFGLSSLRCWLDEYRLQAGCNWRAEITKGVENSQVVVFVVSETSVQSLWCRKELKMSKRLGKIILPLFLQPNVYIDPTLYGLFTIIPKQSKSSYQEMKDNEVLSNVKSLSSVIQSLLRNGSGGEANSSTYNTLLDKYKMEKLIYFTFNQNDRILSDFIKETIVEKNHLPLISNDEINGKLDQDQDPYSLVNLTKEKNRNIKIRKLKSIHSKQIQDLKSIHSKQLWKLSKKVEKKLFKLNLDSSSLDYQLTKLQLEKDLDLIQIKSNQNLEYLNLRKLQLNQLKLKFNLNINDELNQLELNNNNNNNNSDDNYNIYNFNNNISYSYNNNNNNSIDSYNGYNSIYNNNQKEEEENNVPILNSYISSENNIPILNNYISSENNIPILNSYISIENSNNDSYNYISTDNSNNFNHISNQYNNSDQENNNEIKYNIKDNNLDYLKNCLLHLVLFTKKTTDIQFDNYMEEIKYTLSLKKTVIIITPDMSLKTNDSTPSLLKDLVWFEIDIKNINQVFDNIILIYDILEKTNQITNQINNFQTN